MTEYQPTIDRDPSLAPSLGGASARRALVEIYAGDGLPGMIDGEAGAARFNEPWGIVADAAGNLYVADSRNHRIRKITPDGVVSTVAGVGIEGYADGVGVAARFNLPRGVAVDAAGNVFVADTGNDRIRKVTPQGHVSTHSGEGVRGFRDGARAVARYNLPNGLAIDAAGWVYVADTANVRVRKVSPGGTASTLAGEGAMGYADGCGPDARFSSPRAVAVGPDGVVYVVECGNSRVRRIASDGTVSLVAGDGRGRHADGPGAQASFREPCGVAVTPAGGILVADTDNNCVRLIDPAGEVFTIAGDGRGDPDLVDGIGPAARFSTPTGICALPDGTVYVADAKNHCIRRISPA